MNRSLCNVLEFSGEAAFLESGGRVAFANAAARRMLGEDCVGRGLRELLGESVAGAQAPSFMACVPREDGSFVLRAAKTEEGRAFFLSSPSETPALLNEPFLYQLRNATMNVCISTDILRQRAEELADAGLLDVARTLTRTYYQFKRLSANATTALSAADGALHCEPTPLDLSQLCEELLDTVRSFLPDLPLKTELGKGIVAQADPSLVCLLLTNLLSNCISHAAGFSRISVSLSDSAGNVVLSVDDDGRGVPEELLPCVFDRYAFPFPPNAVMKGPGLGLTVARAITAAHGGALLLESRAGRGTTVRVCLGKRIPLSPVLRSPRVDPNAFNGAVLMGLSNCLPDDCYSEKFTD